MIYRLGLPTALVAALLASSAFAQSANPSTANTSGSSSMNSNTTNNSQNLPQQIESKLQSQGFTDVQVVPGSFIVSAKDKQGDPVTMIIGPHSMAVFAVNSSSSTVGSNSGQNSQGAQK